MTPVVLWRDSIERQLSDYLQSAQQAVAGVLPIVNVKFGPLTHPITVSTCDTDERPNRTATREQVRANA